MRCQDAIERIAMLTHKPPSSQCYIDANGQKYIVRLFNNGQEITLSSNRFRPLP